MKNAVLQMNDNYQQMVIAYQHKGCALSCLVLPPGGVFSHGNNPRAGVAYPCSIIYQKRITRFLHVLNVLSMKQEGNLPIPQLRGVSRQTLNALDKPSRTRWSVEGKFRGVLNFERGHVSEEYKFSAKFSRVA